MLFNITKVAWSIGQLDQFIILRWEFQVGVSVGKQTITLPSSASGGQTNFRPSFDKEEDGTN